MAKAAPSSKLEEEISKLEGHEPISLEEQEKQFDIFLKQIFSKLGKQDELLAVCKKNTHAHLRSGEERSPPIN